MERMEKYIYKTNILEYLDDSVDRDPDKLAYQDEYESLTFKEYMEACMRIGSGIKQFGLHKEPVAMLMDARHISHLKTSMGIVYSGCFYIPLDPASPTERIRTIFDKLNPSLVLYDEKGSVHKEALGDQYQFIDYKSLLDTPIDSYFRTGDLGYLNKEGKLVVTGRKDSMIKHKGYRMELGEVEFAAMGTGKAGTCCCLLDREVEDGELFLFYTGSIKEKDLRTALRRILPKYAVPENIIHMNQMPYNANRKADRQALARMIPDYKNQ